MPDKFENRAMFYIFRPTRNVDAPHLAPQKESRYKVITPKGIPLDEYCDPGEELGINGISAFHLFDHRDTCDELKEIFDFDDFDYVISFKTAVKGDCVIIKDIHPDTGNIKWKCFMLIDYYEDINFYRYHPSLTNPERENIKITPIKGREPYAYYEISESKLNGYTFNYMKLQLKNGG